MGLEDLPHVNASLNSLSAVLLFFGYWAIRQQNEKLHARLMCAALIVSAAFLTCYLTYHASDLPEQTYNWIPSLKYPYYVMLISHIILAAVMVPMILRVFYLAFKKRLPQHVKLGRITLAIWFYVSVTGVLIYLILYQFQTP